MPKHQETKQRRITVEEKLAQAVRNSLNLPRLRVEVRHNRIRQTWLFRLQQGSQSSEALELNDSAVAVMKKVGLLPPLYLGVFRLAYAALQTKNHATR